MPLFLPSHLHRQQFNSCPLTRSQLIAQIRAKRSYLCVGLDTGKPALLNGDALSQRAFDEVAQQVARWVSIRNARLEPTKVVPTAV